MNIAVTGQPYAYVETVTAGPADCAEPKSYRALVRSSGLAEHTLANGAADAARFLNVVFVWHLVRASD